MHAPMPNEGGGSSRVFADLHTHSTCSDGVLSCEEMLAAARRDSLAVLAVTDHDTMEGAVELAAAIAAAAPSDADATASGADMAGEAGLGVCDAGADSVPEAPAGARQMKAVPGMELSTQRDGRPVHILAYFCGEGDAALAEICVRTNESRTERALTIAERLEAAGYPVHPEELATCGKVVNRSLVARALVKAGAAPDTDTVFDTLIGLDCPYYVDRADIDSLEAIALVREAGGFPFIAHPAAYHVVDLIAAFAREGLAGVEAFYPQHTQKERAELALLAGELGLAVSGGSDWHGDATHGSSLGAAGLDRAQFAAFIEACGRDAREWGAL